MTVGTFHAYYTLVLFIAMVAIIGWAYTKKNRQQFERAAGLVFADERQTEQPEQK
ncbi:MAG: cbb3-type cytochrome c oxidase subunit 3 [Ferrimonas sp.]